MDIEPLWALGGWFIFSNCMAAATTTKTKTSTLATYTRSHYVLFLLAVFFIFLLLTGPAANPMKPYSTAVSVPIKRILLESSSESESATMNLHASSTSSSKPSRARFGADEHEVPSGPNPISN